MLKNDKKLDMDVNQVSYEYEFPPEEDENTVRKSVLLQNLLIIRDLSDQLKFVTDRAFKSVDEDGSGGLDSGELHTIMTEVAVQMGVHPPTKEDLEDILC